jgi:hypothetical protein
MEGKDATPAYVATRERKGNDEGGVSPQLADGPARRAAVPAVSGTGQNSRRCPFRQCHGKEQQMRGTLGLIVLIILVVIALRFFGVI